MTLTITLASRRTSVPIVQVKSNLIRKLLSGHTGRQTDTAVRSLSPATIKWSLTMVTCMLLVYQVAAIKKTKRKKRADSKARQSRCFPTAPCSYLDLLIRKYQAKFSFVIFTLNVFIKHLKKAIAEHGKIY